MSARRVSATDILMIGVVLAIVLPVLWMVYLAFLAPVDIISPGFTARFSLANFDEFFGPGSYLPAQLGNSLAIVVGTVVICLAVAALAGYSLSRLAWPSWVTWGMLGVLGLLQLIPPITLVPGLYATLSQFGLLGGVPGLIMLNVVFNLPFAALMMKIYFDGVPAELREAGLVDGASESRVFRSLMLPLVRPGLAAVTVFVGIMAWNEFLFGLVFTSGGTTAPITVGIASLVQPYKIDFGPMAAVGVVTAVPIIALAALANRQIVAGLTASAVKG